jgi:hypothetical protein
MKNKVSIMYIMSTLNSYLFNNISGLRSDMTDQTQQNIQNTRFGAYSVSNYFSENTSDNQIKFATSQPGLYVSNAGISGGLASSAVDFESQLLTPIMDRSVDGKVQLFQRPFATVPYLGRGSGDPTLESKLQQGEIVSDKKSVSTVSELSYMDYSSYPMMDSLRQQIANPSNSVQELAMDGWVRGGVSAREVVADSSFSNNIRPNPKF